jgi:hypothetical protein
MIGFPDLRSRYTFPTVRIRPGEQVEMYMVIPPRCLAGSDCRFTIWADHGNQVNESDERNNRRDGRCRGRRTSRMLGLMLWQERGETRKQAISKIKKKSS